WILPEPAREIVFSCCLHDHQVRYELQAVVVMPDHVHMAFVPLINVEKQETRSLAEIMDALKGASAHMINRKLGRKGKVWQEESFDRVLRSSEDFDEKIAYILNNPVRQGIVSTPAEYPWLWTATGELRSPAQPGAAGPTQIPATN
ncbi:MAG: transposase, partial [Terriglobales bacterium]